MQGFAFGFLTLVTLPVESYTHMVTLRVESYTYQENSCLIQDSAEWSADQIGPRAFIL